MRTVEEIYNWLDKLAPFRSAMDFDNSGLLAGSPVQQVSKALLSLDITREVVEEAASVGAELILSHHPVIFDPLRRISEKDPAYWLARYGIAAICAHTNLDMAPFGVNTCLAERLGLVNVRGEGILPETGAPSFFLGELPEELPPEAFAALVKESLSAGSVQYTRGNEKIRLVGLCSGAGGDEAQAAFALGAEAFVTGEVKHHQFIAAKALEKTLVAAGHFATEDVVTEPLKARLQADFPDIWFVKSKSFTDPVCYQ